ncbi:hypothetical protein P3X46_024058 [Hevea brasiliensis]|uniref:DELLA protein n=1 Tax=Hevea brasiliensis TaxID=3981 RepID=A0ABQ9LD12_HEVBR|nr:hypothetical protein P3X46_024058 [Hevea brasiliensis]
MPPEVPKFIDHFQDEMETFSMVDNVFGDVPMLLGGDELEISIDSFEDFVAVPRFEEVSYDVDQGLYLVRLLLACAEAVGYVQLANLILGQIWASVNPWGDSLQRLCYCFATGLKSRLSLFHTVNANGTFTNRGMVVSFIATGEKMEAFQLLYQTTPHIAFAAKGKDSLHVIDLGMDQTLQWPSFIRSLDLINEQNLLELEASMNALVEDASSLGVSLEFNMISESITPSLLTRENLNLREGEALFVNSIMHLHNFAKESRGYFKAVLQAIKKLNPTLLTVVEQDANHNGPFFFLGDFLNLFTTILPFLIPLRLRHEKADQWRRQLGRTGFQVVGLKCMSQAGMMLSVYGCEGYILASENGSPPWLERKAYHAGAFMASAECFFFFCLMLG